MSREINLEAGLAGSTPQRATRIQDTAEPETTMHVVSRNGLLG